MHAGAPPLVAGGTAGGCGHNGMLTRRRRANAAVPLAAHCAGSALCTGSTMNKEAVALQTSLTLPSISPAFLVEFSMALMREDCSEQLFSSMQLYSVCGVGEGGKDGR